MGAVVDLSLYSYNRGRSGAIFFSLNCRNKRIKQGYKILQTTAQDIFAPHFAFLEIIRGSNIITAWTQALLYLVDDEVGMVEIDHKRCAYLLPSQAGWAGYYEGTSDAERRERNAIAAMKKGDKFLIRYGLTSGRRC